MTATTTGTPSGAHSPQSQPTTGSLSGFDHARAVGFYSAAVGVPALLLNNVPQFIPKVGEFLGGVSDAANVKVVGASVITAASTYLGTGIDPKGVGRKARSTVEATVGGAGFGYGLSNMFTGGWFERGSLGGAAMGAIAVGALAAKNKWEDRKASIVGTQRVTVGHRASQGARGVGRSVAGFLSGARNRAPGDGKIKRGIIGAMGGLALSGATNLVDWPKGGMNTFGTVVSAGVLSAAAVWGGKARDKFGKLSKKNKYIAGAVGATALAFGAYGVYRFGFTPNGGSGDTRERVADEVGSRPRGGGSSTTLGTTEVPSTTGGGSNPGTTLPEAMPAEPSGSRVLDIRDSVSVNNWKADQMPGMKRQILEQYPDLTNPQLNDVADQVLSDQVKQLQWGDPEKFTRLIEGSQSAADRMTAQEIEQLVAAA